MTDVAHGSRARASDTFVDALVPDRAVAVPSRAWMTQYRLLLLAADLCAISAATAIGYAIRFGQAERSGGPARPASS